MATEMTVKLLVDKNRNKVLFAEAGKDFVDFLFSLLTLPMGTIVKLLTPTHIPTGCIGNLYSSVDNLDNLYIQPDVQKSLVLEPKIGYCSNEMQMLLMQSANSSQSNEPPTLYGCTNSYHNSSCGGYVSYVMETKCGSCQQNMTRKVCVVEGESSTVAKSGVGGGGGGYVKEVVTYMITDDLEVKPMSTISSITFLNRYDIKDIGALEDRVVHLGMKEGLDLLKTSLQSKSVLSDVFLKEEI
ncbi:uncharacterized protein LOC122066562 isoform X2 [Macadamia integrifolia]|uniref:uncharacterized protein LOC122066562 isoform X2 n=1 Tax=Macadamia integrifolia TaxID=60698 RepID=UPI001C4F2570|nr:uncharacterized protein LOC122066562 isoform X2 [Macadamia integrifolia]